MASEKDATCENDPNFAIICTFFQKFSTMLNIQPPDIQRLREWLENIDEVPPGLKMLHIKLLRKLRKTVHETAWETALSKFCYTYSSQDAWEIERFGYKKSSLKVKLRILKELMESQFQRNGRFRSIFTSLSADSLRSEPIGRDKLGHAYYLTQDRQCNLRIYQEHLDEEIWQVVASNRDELVNLIARLKGNEVVLPSVVVDEDSSSNSNTAVEKPPPPEEHDSQEEEEDEDKTNKETEEKIPNIKIKLGAIKPTLEVVSKDPEKKQDEANENEKSNEEEQQKDSIAKTDIKAENHKNEGENELQDENLENAEKKEENEVSAERIDNNESDKSVNEVNEEIEKETSGLKTEIITDDNINGDEKSNDNNKDKTKNGETEIIQGSESKNMKKRLSEDTDKEDQNSHETPAKKFRPTLLDANREKKKSRYEKYHPESDEEEELEEEITEEEEDTEEVEAEAEDEDGVGDEIVENVMVFKGEGTGKDCESSYIDILFGCEDLTEKSPVVGEEIEEETFYVYGEGSGKSCLVGNSKECSEYESETKREIKYEVKKISEKSEETVLKNSEKLINCKDKSSVDKQNNEEIKNGEKPDSTSDVSKLSCPVSKLEPTDSCTKPQNEVHSKELENDEPTDLSFSGKDKKEDKSEVNASDNKPRSKQSSVNCNNSSANRKRKLSTEENRRQISESDGDLNSEAEEIEETDEAIGGKRLKMRSKIINSNIRKSVEKRRNEVQKESSSEDEIISNAKKDKLTDLVLDKKEYLNINEVENSIKNDIKSENDGEDTEDEDSIENNAAQSVKNEKEDESVPEFEKEDIKTEDLKENQNGNEESMAEPPVQSKPKGKRQKKRKRKKAKAATNRNNAKPKKKVDGNSETKKDEKVSEESKTKKQENKKADSLENSDTKETEPTKSTKKQRRKLDVDTSNIIEHESEVAPVRQSRRIAQLKIKEEAERRKLEEIALKKMKQDLKKKKKEEKKKTDSTYTIMLPSEPSDRESEIDSELEMKKKLEKKKRGLKKGGWSSGSDDEEEQEEDEIESYAGSPLFRSDHEFSPESDLEDESQIVPLKRARTAKKEGEIDTTSIDESNEACQKCGKTDHPEWILLCDKCDTGYHCSCLSPMLFIIPEGDWFCPPCQQEQLIEALENHLKAYDELVATKKAEEEKRAQDLKILQEQAEEEAKAARLATGGKQPRKKYSNRESPDRQRRRKRYNISRGKTFGSENSDSDDDSRSSSDSRSFSSASSSSSDDDSTSSDDVPIYKLRKRRQTNVSYRLHEYDDLIDSAIKEEMDEVAGAGNLGRGKDISTIIEADKEEKLRLKQLEARKSLSIDREGIENQVENEQQPQTEGEVTETKVIDENAKDDDSGSDFNPRKSKMSLLSRRNLKKKGRKLNCLEVSSEEDPSDEDFKTSSYETEDEEDESISGSTDSDSSLEVYRHRNKKEKRSKRATRRAARERNKRYIDKDFIADSTDDSDVPLILKKKRKEDSEYSASETDEEDESEEVDSEELCDDTTESESDGAWRPSKRKKQKKAPLTPSFPKKKISKKQKGSKKSDDTRAFKAGGYSKKKHFSDEDSMDSSRRTRGKRFTYLEDYEDESSDDGIKPGVKRPDTPPEEREQFIKRQEEIKRMLAEKNSTAAKVVPAPTIPLLEKRKQIEEVVEETASISTVPLSVIKGAKALDIDYLQRKGELGSDGGESEFDDDLPEDFNPEDMDEEEIAKMMEEEDFAQQQLKLAGEVIRQKKLKESDQPVSKPEEQIPRQVKVVSTLPPDPIRKKLPMPTIYPLITTNPQFSKIVNNPTVLNKSPPPPNRVLMHTSQRSQSGPISPPFAPIPPSAPSVQPNPLPPQAIINKLPLINCAPPPSLPTNQSPILPIENRQQPSSEEINASDLSKPRGRRKKITPLRESLQKQPTPTVLTTNTTSAINVIPPSTIGTPTVISPASSRESISPISDKSNLVGVTNLSIAQPPQLYKPQSSPQPSVITRLPQLPPRPRFPDQNARFFPPNQLGHRLPPPRLAGMPLPPHHLIRSYVSGPPPLRSSAAPPSVNLSSNIIRHQLLSQSPFANSEQFSPRSRHSSPSLNPYRPPLFGSPGYPPVPQGPPPPASHQSQSRSALSLTSGPSAAQISLASSLVSAANEFPGSNRIIQTPYGPYYPPIGTSHSTPPPPIATAVPSSVIVTAAPSNPSTPVTVPTASVPPPPPPAAALPPTNTVLTTANAVTSQPSVSKAAPLETFDAKTTPPPLETESARSPYSVTSQEGNEDDPPETASNTTSEFSGLVSYFSSQQDDLNT